MATNNYETDLTRVPIVKQGLLAEQLKQRLKIYEPLIGVKPMME